MNKIFTIFLLFFICQLIYAQDTIKYKQILSISGGLIAYIPKIDNYSINNVYEWDNYVPGNINEYDANVNSETSLGTFITITFKKCLVNNNNSYLYLSVDLSYKNSDYGIKYQSNETYNDSSIINGKGTVKWEEHYITPSLGISLLNKIGRKFFIENNLSISKGILIVSREEIIFDGIKAKGMNNIEPYNRNIRSSYSIKSYPIQTDLLDIYYEVGFGYKIMKNIIIMSDITIPFFNIQKKVLGSPLKYIGYYKNPLFVRKNYNEMLWGFKLNFILK